MGLSLLFIFGIISCYTGVLLKQCLDSTPGLQTYPDIGQAAFGTIGRLFISVKSLKHVLQYAFLCPVSIEQGSCWKKIAYDRNLCYPI